MKGPRSEDLRIRVIAAVEEDGLSRRAAARRFKVSEASAVRWVAAFEEDGRTTPLPMGGDRRSVLKPHRMWLIALRLEENDLTLAAIAARLRAEHGVKADASMLSRFFKAEGISFKKNRARQRAGAPGRRRASRRLVPGPG
jgi:putative transposase